MRFLILWCGHLVAIFSGLLLLVSFIAVKIGARCPTKSFTVHGIGSLALTASVLFECSVQCTLIADEMQFNSVGFTNVKAYRLGKTKCNVECIMMLCEKYKQTTIADVMNAS